MKKLVLKASLFLLLAGGMFNAAVAQTPSKAVLNWYNGKNPGMGTEAAYKLVGKKTAKPVVVAVIDSGVDIEHEDLQGQIWTNTKEIPGNKIDDDKNGYIDDIHGWNFLGNADGRNANDEQLEFVRIYKAGKARFENKAEADISAADRDAYKLWLECEAKLKKERAEAEEQLAGIAQFEEQLPMLKAMIQQSVGKENYTEKDLMKWKPKTDMEKQLQGLGVEMLKPSFIQEIEEGKKHFDDQLKYNLNPDFDGRAIVGDNPNNLNDKNYGNGDVEGPDALHGTHVAGIIGAVRHNKIGGDGVAVPVQIMSVRAVPNGDEYDKDIAAAIRYAVDNGAQVINMSFGKSYSSQPEAVYEAMKYAESKGVLLVHAAGNDGSDIDIEPNFPAVKFAFQKEDFKNLLTVGASTRYADGKLAASFSNYGIGSVDVFAPGLEIYNTVPNNKYQELQGTSMAAPMVTGVAAFLKAYFPSLSMFEIRDIIIKSGTVYSGTKHVKPGSKENVDFKTLSKSGVVVNLPAAVKMAEAASAAKN